MAANGPEHELVRKAFSEHEYRTMPGLMADTGLSDQKIASIVKQIGGEVFVNEKKGCDRYICRYNGENDELVLEMEDE